MFDPRARMPRRRFLARGVQAAGMVGLGLAASPLLRVGTARAGAETQGADAFGPLGDPDPNGLRLPPGYSSRVVAVAGSPVGGGEYLWPRYPDGGACFATPDGGWIYVANSEQSLSRGGVGAVRFDADGTIVDAYPILRGTNLNCAGGPTPWGTWLSCEEIDRGRVWECDPFGVNEAIPRPALGRYKHEAAAVDPVHETVYLTEDRSDGLLYRFTPERYPDLGAGLLEVAQILDPEGRGKIAPGETRALAWHAVPDPSGSGANTRDQLGPTPTRFRRGEGCWYEGGIVYFATTQDDRVWAVDTAAQTIEIVYDPATSANPILSGADNVYASSVGDVYVAEDGGDMQLVALTAGGQVRPALQVIGHDGSEIAGAALSPDGQRLYFSSQRGPTPNGRIGVTFEVRGPFTPAPIPPSTGSVPRVRSAPNPFRGRTEIEFELAQSAPTRVDVYDLRGRHVACLLDENVERGIHPTAWDGRNERGRAVAPGSYVVRVRTAAAVASLRVTYLG